MFVLEWFYNTRNFILTTFCSFLVTQSSHSICDDVEEANALPSRLAGIRGSPELIKALLKKHFIKNVERQQNYQTCENKRLIWKGRKHIANYKAVTCFFFFNQSTRVSDCCQAFCIESYWRCSLFNITWEFFAVPNWHWILHQLILKQNEKLRYCGL